MKNAPLKSAAFQSLASKLRQKRAALVCACGCNPAINSPLRHDQEPPFKRRLRLAGLDAAESGSEPVAS